MGNHDEIERLRAFHALGLQRRYLCRYREELLARDQLPHSVKIYMLEEIDDLISLVEDREDALDCGEPFAPPCRIAVERLEIARCDKALADIPMEPGPAWTSQWVKILNLYNPGV